MGSEIRTHSLELPTVVVQFCGRKEPRRAGDGNFLHTEVDTENRSVLGCPCFIGIRFVFAEPEMQIPLTATIVERRLSWFPRLRGKELVLVAISVIGENEVRAYS